MTEDELYDLSDEELEAAFKEAKAAQASPDIDLDEDQATAEVEEDLGEVDDSEDEIDLDEELNDDPEQSDADSEDHDTSEEEEVEADSDEDAEETDEDTPDGETEEDETEPTDEDVEAEPEAQQEVRKHKFKANGQEFEFDDKEIMEQFPKIFGQAMDYTKKMQAIKPYRKTIDAIEQAGLGHEDINLMIDVLKGDKEAVTEVLKRTGVDALDLDTENSGYVAKDYGRDEQALALKDVIDDISKDREYSITENIVGKQWDDASWKEMSQQPETIRGLHVDVQSGMYDIVSPIANKLKVYDGGRKSDLEYYKDAARQYFSELQRTEALQARQEEEASRLQAEADKAAKEQARLDQIRQNEAKRTATTKASKKRKAAATTKSKAGMKQGVDYLDDSDEAFEEWYKKTMD
jgi:hypothetical protein